MPERRRVFAWAMSLFLGACSSSHKIPLIPPDRRPLLNAGPLSQPEPAPANAPPPGQPVAKPPDFPRTLALGSFAEGDRIADLTALGQDHGALLAWVTYFDGKGITPRVSAARASPKASAGPRQPSQQGASVMVRAIDAQGEPSSAVNVISVKADSIGGVALAPGPVSQEIGLAWVGKDAGIGQVFLTRLSPTGQKQGQRMLTRSKEGCSDVGLAPWKDGWIVSYVELRDGKPGVYVAKVSRDLQRVGTERLVSVAQGEASEVRVVARGDELLVAWSEARTSPSLFGIFAARLSLSDLTHRGDPARITLTPQHTKGLRLASFRDGVLFGWIEDPAPVSGPPQAEAARTLVLAWIDASARGAPEAVRIPALDASSLTLACERVCRVVVAGADGDALALHGFVYDRPGTTTAPGRLATISGISTEDASPVVVKDWLFFSEDDLRGGGRIRKAQLAWH